MSNTDFILSLINKDRFTFEDYAESLDFDLNEISLEYAMLYVWIDRWELVNKEERLKQYFIDNIISEGKKIKTYRGLYLDDSFVGMTDEEILNYVRGNSEDLVSTTTSLDTAIGYSDLMGTKFILILECTGTEYKSLEDFEVCYESEIIMYKPKIRIHSIERKWLKQ